MLNTTEKRVNRHTRAGAAGKVLRCPNCGATHRVFHFSWSASVCQGCGDWIDKTEYTVATENDA